MKTTMIFLLMFGALGFMACSNDEFSSIGTNGAAATTTTTTCGSGYTLVNSACIATVTATATPTTGATATPTATPSTTTSCSSGYIYSPQHGCIPSNSCPTGYGIWQNQCIQIVVVTVTNVCQGICPTGAIQTPYGCMPQTPYCPPCLGLGSDGFCYYATHYLDFLNGY